MLSLIVKVILVLLIMGQTIDLLAEAQNLKVELSDVRQIEWDGA